MQDSLLSAIDNVNLLVERLHERADENKTGNGVAIDIAPWFSYTAFDTFVDLGFGVSFDCLQNSRYHLWIALLFNSVKAAAFVGGYRRVRLRMVVVKRNILFLNTASC